MLPQHEGMPRVSFLHFVRPSAFGRACTTLTLFNGARRRFERQVPRLAVHEVEKLERRQAQQEKALAGFSENQKQQRLGHLIQEHWGHIEASSTKPSKPSSETGGPPCQSHQEHPRIVGAASRPNHHGYCPTGTTKRRARRWRWNSTLRSIKTLSATLKPHASRRTRPRGPLKPSLRPNGAQAGSQKRPNKASGSSTGSSEASACGLNSTVGDG